MDLACISNKPFLQVYFAQYFCSVFVFLNPSNGETKEQNRTKKVGYCNEPDLVALREDMAHLGAFG